MTREAKLRDRSVEKILQDVDGLNPTELERCAVALTQIIEGGALIHRGTTIDGRPAGYTVDGFSEDHRLIVECSVDKSYFEKGMGKMAGDIAHAKAKGPNCRRLYLYATQVCPNSVWEDVGKVCREQEFNECRITVFDGRRIAEQIYERVIAENASVETFSTWLPNLKRLFSDFLFERGAPPLPADFVADKERFEIIEKNVADHKIIAIVGLSGSGKTYAIREYVARSSGGYASVVWLDGVDLLTVSDMRAVRISRLGHEFNLAAKIADIPTLVIVDSFERDAAQVAQMIPALNPGSRVLISSQQPAGSLVFNCELPEINDVVAKNILTIGGVAPPTDQEFTALLAATGRHPLTLAIVRDTVRETGVTWADMLSELPHNVPSLELPDRVTLLHRLLERHGATISAEVHVLKWLDQPLLDRRFLELVLGPVGIRKLYNRSLLSSSDHGYLRIHDLILICIRQFSLQLPKCVGPQQRFWQYLKDYWESSPIHFQRVLHLHRGRIAEGLNLQQPVASLQSYLCLLVENGPITPEGINALANTLLESVIGDRAALAATLEAIERNWRTAPSDEKTELLRSAEIRLTEALALNSEDQMKADLLHHRGKFRRWLKDFRAAQSDFEVVLKLYPESWAAHLQNARVLLAQGKPDDGATHLLRIFDRFDASPASVPATSVLAALAELSRREYKNLREKILSERLEMVRSAISRSLVNGFSQPYRVLGRLGGSLYYHNPEVLLSMAAAIDFPSVETASPDEYFDIAEAMQAIGRAHGEINHDGVAEKNWARRAIEYYTRVPKPRPFNVVRYAACLLVVDEFTDAANSLDMIAESERDAFWYLRRAQAHLGLGELSAGKSIIEAGLKKLHGQAFRNAFLLTRARIEYQSGEKNCVITLNEAIASETSPKFKKDLEAELTKAAIRFAQAD